VQTLDVVYGLFRNMRDVVNGEPVHWTNAWY
jgi:hypothetical protein